MRMAEHYIVAPIAPRSPAPTLRLPTHTGDIACCTMLCYDMTEQYAYDTSGHCSGAGLDAQSFDHSVCPAFASSTGRYSVILHCNGL